METKFERLECLNDNNVHSVKKGEVYWGYEENNLWLIYSEPAFEDKDGNETMVGKYAKSRFINRAKWREEQIDSILND